MQTNINIEEVMDYASETPHLTAIRVGNGVAIVGFHEFREIEAFQEEYGCPSNFTACGITVDQSKAFAQGWVTIGDRRDAAWTPEEAGRPQHEDELMMYCTGDGTSRHYVGLHIPEN